MGESRGMCIGDEQVRVYVVEEVDQLPPGLRKQYELQLQLMEDDGVPAVEFLNVAASITPNGAGST